MRTTRTARLGGVLLGVALIVARSDADEPTPPTAATKTVTITGAAGSGRVTSNGNRIDCQVANGVASGTCSAAFDSGSVATLTATAATDQEFVAWSGDCTGVTCAITVTRDATASPRFVSAQSIVTMSLTTPNADDGGILFTISGPSILGVTPAAGVDLIETRSTAGGTTTSTILARGTLANGALGTLTVRGVHVDSPYAVEVKEAAARASGGYVQRTNLSAYRIQVQK